MKTDHDELAFCRYLDERYCEDVTVGDTDRLIRRARCRDLITRMGDADKPDSKGTTLAQAFERVYGEPLLHVEHQQHENNDGV